MAYNFKPEDLFRFGPQEDFEDRIGARSDRMDAHARDDAFAGDESAPVTGNVFADNGSGADSANKGGLTIMMVEGQSMAVGQAITLDSGALLTLNADGSFSYDYNGAFGDLDDADSATDSFTYTVASDRAPLARDQATVTITINGGENAPLITSGASASVGENQTATGYTATVTDADAGDTVSFSITGGADSALFSIDADTGELSFDAAPDFETPGDTGADNGYEVEITATDGGGLTDAQLVIVTVTNQNEAPVMTSLTRLIAMEEVSINDSVLVLTVSVDDPDSGDSMTFSLTGDDAAAFAIDESTGQVTFAGPLDYENPTDADGDNIYEYTVIATDQGGMSDSLSFTLQVWDSVEDPPSFPGRAGKTVGVIEDMALAMDSGAVPAAGTALLALHPVYVTQEVAPDGSFYDVLHSENPDGWLG